jgi:outer membrane protein
MKINNVLSRCIILLLFAPVAFAVDLLALYQMALQNDPELQAAYHQKHADTEALPQARANLLPNVSASATSTANHSTAPNLRKYNSHVYLLKISQPIFHFDSWTKYSQAKSKIKIASAQYAAKEQDLIIRLSTQYFNVLKAQDNLQLTTQKKQSFAKHLEETQQRFKAGLSAITDVNEAEARHDHARAQEIVFNNRVVTEYAKLNEIVGSNITKLAKLSDKLQLKPPIPDNLEHWLNTAVEQNLTLQTAKYNLQISKQQISAERTGHLPSLQLDGTISRYKPPPSYTPTKDLTDKSIGLTLSVPLFSGGAISSKTRAAIATYGVASHNLEKLLREIRNNTKQSYNTIIMQIQQIAALQKTVISSTNALKATEDAFLVGTRTIVDVLTAQSDLLTEQNDYTQAHYDYLLESLKLKQAIGSLNIEDVQHINGFLQ